MAFTVGLVRTDTGPLLFGRCFGQIGLAKLAYGKSRFNWEIAS